MCDSSVFIYRAVDGGCGAV